jgi:hypothetical protein
MKATRIEREINVGNQIVKLYPGQLLFGRVSASHETCLSQQNIRTAIKLLSANQQITIKPTNKFSIITVNNWDSYQSDSDGANQQDQPKVTNRKPTDNQQITTNKNVEKVKNVKNNKYPDWLDPDLWKEFKRHRVQLKSKMTNTAEGRNINTLKKIMDDTGATQDQVIGQSIERGWKGLFPVKDYSGDNNDAYRELRNRLKKSGKLV